MIYCNNHDESPIFDWDPDFPLRSRPRFWTETDSPLGFCTGLRPCVLLQTNPDREKPVATSFSAHYSHHTLSPLTFCEWLTFEQFFVMESSRMSKWEHFALGFLDAPQFPSFLIFFNNFFQIFFVFFFGSVCLGVLFVYWFDCFWQECADVVLFPSRCWFSRFLLLYCCKRVQQWTQTSGTGESNKKISVSEDVKNHVFLLRKIRETMNSNFWTQEEISSKKQKLQGRESNPGFLRDRQEY